MDCKTTGSESYQVLFQIDFAVFVGLEVQATGHHYV